MIDGINPRTRILAPYIFTILNELLCCSKNMSISHSLFSIILMLCDAQILLIIFLIIFVSGKISVVVPIFDSFSKYNFPSRAIITIFGCWDSKESTSCS